MKTHYALVAALALSANVAISAELDSLDPKTFDINSEAPSGTLNQVIAFVANQLANNRTLMNVSDSRIAVSSFVNIDNLEETDKLGLSIAEGLMHEMHVRGFGVVDFKTRENLRIRQSGDFIFSRDVADLKRTHNVHYFLSGTITRNSDGAVINARLVQADNSLIVSTAQGFISNKNLSRIHTGYGRNVEKIVVERPVVPSMNTTPVSLR